MLNVSGHATHAAALDTRIATGEISIGRKRALGETRRAGGREAAARHVRVDVTMARHGQAAHVEHGGYPNLHAESLWVSGDRQHRLRRRPEQEDVGRGLVLEDDVGNLCRHGEHDADSGRVPSRAPAQCRQA